MRSETIIFAHNSDDDDDDNISKLVSSPMSLTFDRIRDRVLLRRQLRCRLGLINGRPPPASRDRRQLRASGVSVRRRGIRRQAMQNYQPGRRRRRRRTAARQAKYYRSPGLEKRITFSPRMVSGRGYNTYRAAKPEA